MKRCLASLIAELPDGMVVTDPAITEGYRQDRAFDPVGRQTAGRGAAATHRRGADRAALGHRPSGARW